MHYAKPLISGTLVKRYKRFLADVELADGTLVTAHCPNTGAMTGCAEPGFEVWLCPNNDPKRKLKYSWEVAVNGQQHKIGINTHNANKLVFEALQNQQIEAWRGYSQIKREVAFGAENSKVDFLLTDSAGGERYLEVKSVTLLQEGLGYFPDTVTQRGQKHLRELMQVVEQGHSASLLFCAQHTGINSVRAAETLDPKYAELLAQAADKGVQILAYGCRIDREEMVLSHEIPFVSDR